MCLASFLRRRELDAWHEARLEGTRTHSDMSSYSSSKTRACDMAVASSLPVVSKGLANLSVRRYCDLMVRVRIYR